MTMVLDKKGLMSAMALKREAVSLPEGDVLICEMGAIPYVETFNDPSVKKENGETDMAKFTALLVVRSIVDKSGKRILDDDDVDMLRSGSMINYGMIAKAVNRINGLSSEQGNSAPSQSEDSPSVSA